MTDDSVAEWARKSSVCWLRVDSRIHPVWHAWVDDAICVVGSVVDTGIEQPLPGLADGAGLEVLLRSKADRQLAAAVPVTAFVVEPGSEAWEPVTSALKSARQNLPDLATTVERWARDCIVLRLVPSGPPTPAADLPAERPHTRPRLA